jgi:hypothetical protein
MSRFCIICYNVVTGSHLGTTFHNTDEDQPDIIIETHPINLRQQIVKSRN